MLASCKPTYYKHSPAKSDPDTEAEELEMPDVPKPQRSDEPDNCKAKSSLCKNYMTKGCCPYGKKCQFAHGPS